MVSYFKSHFEAFKKLSHFGDGYENTYVNGKEALGPFSIKTPFWNS